MNWKFWQRVEKRDYSQVLVDAFLERARSSATGQNVVESFLQGAIESACGWWARGFMASTIEPGVGIGPAMLAEIGRGLCRRGESVWYLDLSGMRPVYRVVSGYELRMQGGHEFYQVTYSVPDRLETKHFVSPGSVLHFRYAIDPVAPWRGVGPLQLAGRTVDLLARGEEHFRKEFSSAVGNLLPQPSPPGSEDVKALRESLKNLDGRTAIVQTQRGSWGQQGGASDADWRVTRLGAVLDAAAVNLRAEVQDSIFSACGLPPGLLASGSESSVRDSWRLFLAATIGPVTKVVEEEIGEKILPVKMSLTELRAADVATMARATHSLQQAGFERDTAAKMAGY